MISTRIFALSTLAILAGCSAPPGEDLSSNSAAVTMAFTFHEFTSTGSPVIDVGSCLYDSFGNASVSWVGANDQEFTWNSFNSLVFTGTAVPNTFGSGIDLGGLGAWAVEPTHAIFGWVNGVYEQVSTGQATDIGVSNDGKTTFVAGVPVGGGVGNDFPIYKYVGAPSYWQQMTGQYGVRVDASNDGSAWVVNSAGQVWHVTGSPTAPVATRIGPSWTSATDISVGSDNSVFVVGNGTAGADHGIFVFDPSISDFRQIPGALGTRVAAASSTVITVVNAEGQLWTSAVHHAGLE